MVRDGSSASSSSAPDAALRRAASRSYLDGVSPAAAQSAWRAVSSPGLIVPSANSGSASSWSARPAAISVQASPIRVLRMPDRIVGRRDGYGMSCPSGCQPMYSI